MCVCVCVCSCVDARVAVWVREREGEIECLEALLSYGAATETRNWNGVTALGSDAVLGVPGHTADSCRALCWQDSGCTAWTLVGTDCRTVGVNQTQPVITTDGLNTSCMEKLGFDVGPQSAACADLPLDYAFSTRHNKCVHINDTLLQPWCPEPWTTASTAGADNDILAAPELSRVGAAFASYPRATCVCGDNDHARTHA